MNNRGLLLLVLAVAAVAIPARAAGAETGLWQQLKSGGHILLIRHATTDPGVGDPPGFDLQNCATQRNLSVAGREQAKRLGTALKQLDIPIAAVRSSRWCRCLETARLAFGGAQPWPALDNTFDTPERRPQQMQEVRKLLMQPVSGGNLALITHGVNILALTGISPAESEIVAVRASPDGKFSVVGRGIPYR